MITYSSIGGNRKNFLIGAGILLFCGLAGIGFIVWSSLILAGIATAEPFLRFGIGLRLFFICNSSGDNNSPNKMSKLIGRIILNAAMIALYQAALIGVIPVFPVLFISLVFESIATVVFTISLIFLKAPEENNLDEVKNNISTSSNSGETLKNEKGFSQEIENEASGLTNLRFFNNFSDNQSEREQVCQPEVNTAFGK